MVHIAYSRNYGSAYAGEFIRGMFKDVAFLKYKHNNIALVGVTLNDGDKVEVEEFTDRRVFWNRVRPPVVLTYKQLEDREIYGVAFDIYEVV